MSKSSDNRKAKRARAKRERYRCPDEVLALVEHDSSICKACILCGEHTHHRGVFVPHDSQQYGSATGKQRFIIYALCENESQDRDYLKIERCIAAQIALGKVDSYNP